MTFFMNNKFEIGQVFYAIDPVDFRTFYSECRVCGGEQRLTVNGVTFRCPVCETEATALRVHGWQVRAYKIYKVTEEVEHKFWDISNAEHEVEYELFHKIPRNEACHRIEDVITRRVTQHSLIGGLNKPIYYDETDRYNEEALKDWTFFDDYKLAVEVANKVTQQQINKVKKYNEEHGTAFELPVFNVKHCKKG